LLWNTVSLRALLIGGLVIGRQPDQPAQFFVKFRETDRALFLLGVAQFGLEAADPGAHLAQSGGGLAGGIAPTGWAPAFGLGGASNG